jgi:hypothetical protein
LRILHGSIGLHTACAVADRIGIQYYLSQVWAVRSSEDNIKPQTIDDETLAATANVIGPEVRHWAARLSVSEWEARFEPGDEKPDTVLAARQCQAWWTRYHPFARLIHWQRRLSFARLLQCSAVGKFVFDDDWPGGVRLDIVYPQRLTLDPSNASPDLDDHRNVIESVAMSIEDAKAVFGEALAAKRLELDGEEELRNLAITEEYFGRTLYGLQPGAGQSEEPGVLVHIWFRERFKRRTVILQNPRPKRKNEEDEPAPPQWFVLEDKPWPYGNPYIKLDCFPHPTCPWSRSLALELMPFQNAVSIAHRTEVQAFVKSALYKIILQGGIGNVQNPSALTNNVRGAVVQLLGSAPAPTVLQFPQINAAAETIVNRAMVWIKGTSGIQEPMQGIPIRREMSNQAYQTLISQGLAPIEAVGVLDYAAVSDFVRRAARAAVIRGARVGQREFVAFVGPTRSNRTMLRKAGRALRTSDTLCKLKRGAFLAETPAQVDARLSAELTTRLQSLTDPEARARAFEDYQWERLFLTGYASFAGQEEQLHNAEEFVRQVLDEKRKPEDVRQFDNHRLIKRVIRRLLDTRFISGGNEPQDGGLDEDAVDVLEQTMLWCEQYQYQHRRMAAASQLLQAQTGGASAIPTAGTLEPGSVETPAIAGAPSGELAVAAG